MNVGEPDGATLDAWRCGGKAHVAPKPRGTCRCPLAEQPPNSICPACGGSWWDCCQKTDSEPHTPGCHTRQHDTGVFVCHEDRWA